MYERKPLVSFNLDVPGLARHVDSELQRVSAGFKTPARYVALAELNAAPDKPFVGMVVLADGTNWNPGAGQGVYAYYGGAWNKL